MKNISKKIFFSIFTLYFITSNLYSGVETKDITIKKIDSLNQIFKNYKDTATLFQIFRTAVHLSESIKYNDGLFYAYNNCGTQLRNLSFYTEALKLHTYALNLAITKNKLQLQVNASNNIGVVYRRLNNSQKALDFHMRALKLAEKIKDTLDICIAVNSIGNIYISLNRQDEALRCFHRSLSLDKIRGNNYGMSINYNNIGFVLRNKNQLDSALAYFKKALVYDEIIHHKPGIAICYNSIGEILLRQKKVEEALTYFRNALMLNIEVKDQIYIATSYINLADAYLEKSNLKMSVEFYNKGLAIANSIGSKSQAMQAYSGLSECYKKLRNFEKALCYFEMASAFSDSILNEENIKHITQIQSQYDFDKKEQQIVILEKEKETSKLFNSLLIILVCVIVIISVFIILNIRQKRKIARQEINIKEQRIRDLEREKQLLATQSVLQGEEAERMRLARDLHDGLGGLLSGVKLSMSGIKNRLYLDQEQIPLFNKSIELIDNSIGELRRIAHNMMPEALVKFGVKEALNDFCKNVNNQSTNVIFRFYGSDKRVDRKFENNTYRVAQELINNALKHSQATEIIVQIIQEENRLNLVVQDNGKGFNPNLINATKSAGIANIKSRVESLNGWIDLSSEEGKGTEITIEFNLS